MYGNFRSESENFQSKKNPKEKSAWNYHYAHLKRSFDKNDENCRKNIRRFFLILNAVLTAMLSCVGRCYDHSQLKFRDPLKIEGFFSISLFFHTEVP